MAKTNANARPQKYFGRFNEPLVKLPSLVESQIGSFRDFVEGGAERVFKEFSPIKDHGGKKFEMKLIKFSFGPLRWDEQYAKRPTTRGPIPRHVFPLCHRAHLDRFRSCLGRRTTGFRLYGTSARLGP
jgi:hypothetical protein